MTLQKWEEYFQSLCDKYIAAEHFNAKQTLWGPRINIPWVIGGLNANKLKITPSLKLSSDHTPIIIEYASEPILCRNPEPLCDKTTKWQTFKQLIENNIDNIDKNYTTNSTGNYYLWTKQQANKNNSNRHPWQNQRKKESEKHMNGENKKRLKKVAKEIKSKIKDHNNNEFWKFIETFSAHENANCSLWKATNEIKKSIKYLILPSTAEACGRMSGAQWSLQCNGWWASVESELKQKRTRCLLDLVVENPTLLIFGPDHGLSTGYFNLNWLARGWPK